MSMPQHVGMYRGGLLLGSCRVGGEHGLAHLGYPGQDSTALLGGALPPCHVVLNGLRTLTNQVARVLVLSGRALRPASSKGKERSP